MGLNWRRLSTVLRVCATLLKSGGAPKEPDRLSRGLRHLSLPVDWIVSNIPVRYGEARGALTPAMHSENPRAGLFMTWLGKGLVRFLLLLVATAAVAAVAAGFGIAHDYGYLHASILTGSPGGQYHALAMRLANRAKREHGTLTVSGPTALRFSCCSERNSRGLFAPILRAPRVLPPF
jgi:hypothetical protein